MAEQFNEIYKAMIIGITIFVGGMITLLFIYRYLSSQHTTLRDTYEKPIEYSNVSTPAKVRLVPVSSQELGILSEIRDEIRDEAPIGMVFDMNLNITDQITDLYRQNPRANLPWSSFNLTNNGPDIVYCCVNQWKQPEAGLTMGQSISIDLKKRNAIKRVYIVCNHGDNANVGLHVVK